MSEPTPETAAEAAYVPFDEFRDGLTRGRFRLIVNPALAQRFVWTRANVMPVSIAVTGVGIACALAGYLWTGGLLVAAAIVSRRLMKAQAAKIALHLACASEAAYDEATSSGVLEVQRV